MKFLQALGVIALLSAAYIGYWTVQYRAAERQARRFCDAVPFGADAAAVVARAADIPEFRRAVMNNGTRHVLRFQGPIFNACTCEITLAGGRVSAKAVKWMDD